MVAMDQIVIELKTTLVGLLEEARARRKEVGENPYSSAEIKVLETIVVFLVRAIEKGEANMGKLKSDIKVLAEGSLDDLLENRKGGVIGPKIKELADTLKPGCYKAVDPQGIGWSHFSGRVYEMLGEDKLDKMIRPMKKGKQFFLVKYTPEQMKTLEEKRWIAEEKRKSKLNGGRR